MKGFKKHHDFFCKTSRQYIASAGYGQLITFNLWWDYYDNRYTWGEVLRWPIAYIAFMWVRREDLF